MNVFSFSFSLHMFHTGPRSILHCRDFLMLLMDPMPMNDSNSAETTLVISWHLISAAVTLRWWGQGDSPPRLNPTMRADWRPPSPNDIRLSASDRAMNVWLILCPEWSTYQLLSSAAEPWDAVITCACRYPWTMSGILSCIRTYLPTF
jgi:hypothetical protein